MAVIVLALDAHSQEVYKWPCPGLRLPGVPDTLAASFLRTEKAPRIVQKLGAERKARTRACHRSINLLLHGIH